jgi:Holliday junction resolvase RusA-like endonuclease
MSETHGFTLRIPGEARGKERARHAKGRTYTPAQTVMAENRIYSVWQDAGSPRLPDGPIGLEVELGVVRPASHWTSKRVLTREGVRQFRPFRKKPDVDNALKLVMDALNTCAWTDDVRVIDAHVYRVWSTEPYTLINARSLT